MPGPLHARERLSPARVFASLCRMNADRFQKSFLLLLVIAVTAVFVAMVRDFLMTLLMAAIAAGLAHPLYTRLLRLCRGRRAAASLLTILLLLIVVVGPVLALMGVVASEALKISQIARPWIERQLAEPDALARLIERIPLSGDLAPLRETILTRAGDLAAGAGAFVFNLASSATRGTVWFLFQFFVAIYAMFFFLIDGGSLLKRILYYLPLNERDEARLMERFSSVTRATLKGTVVIGVIQGALAGAAFWAAGIEGAVFWGAVMTALSIIPGIGTGLVWVPAAVILVLGGHLAKGILLALFCALIVGSVDNVLRPRLVGRDTRLHDLLIFLGTVGGLLLFGVFGFVVGPVMAALLVTVWDLYGVAFRDVLPGEGS